MKTIKGKKISYVGTLGSMYDNQSIYVVLNKKEYRIKVAELLPIIQGLEFSVKPARKHEYLELIRCKYCNDLIEGTIQVHHHYEEKK